METIKLTIESVPNDEDVILEIKTNAETTIKNYWSKNIKVVPVEKEAEYTAKIDEFQIANQLKAEVIKEIIN